VTEDVSYTLNTIDRRAVAFNIGSYHSNAWKSDNPKSGVYIADTSKTLDALNCGYPACNQGGIAIVAPVPYTLKIRSGCAVDSRGKAAGKGALIQTDKAATLSVTQDQYLFQPRPVYYIVRRLTPTECARLQGFADRWGDIDEKDSFTPEEYEFWLNVRNTHAAINGRAVKDYTEAQMLTWYNKLHTDSAEYKMWGNGIALPPALYCLQGIVDALEATEDDDWML
jgi:DNA (cytosine-5)-methyltransferase 1